jgi:hypothetical protein
VKIELPEDMMYAKDLLFPLVGALWACGNLLFNAMVEANKIRDRVILGRDGNLTLDLEYRKLMIKNDWLPIAAFVSFACLGFSVLAFWSTYLLIDNQVSARPLTIFVGIASVLMGAAWTPAAYRDLTAMRRSIAQAVDEGNA